MSSKRFLVWGLAGVLFSVGELPAQSQETRSEELWQVELSIPGMAVDTPSPASRMRAFGDWVRARGYDVDRCGMVPTRHGVTIRGTVRDLLPIMSSGLEWRRTGSQPALETQSQYFDPGEIEALVLQTAADHPDLVHAFPVGTTFENRTIWGLEISDRPGQPEDEPAILFNGQHHAREVATSHIVMDVVQSLTDDYGSDSDVTEWVNSYKIICVPMVNPDGVAHVFQADSFWRKNRQSYPPSCVGVDLNRNYPYRWGPDRCGFTSSCSSFAQTYPGPAEASELETLAMMQLADRYQFVMATSYHSFGQFIDYPYACSNGAPGDLMPEHAVIDEMMNGMADAIDAVDATPRYAVFSPASAGALSGDDTSWYYADQGTYSFIVEAGTSFEPAFSDVAGIVARNRGGWRYLFDRLGQSRIDVKVRDGCSGEPLEAEVTLTNFVFDSGESPRFTTADFGRWTFLVVANTSHQVRVEKPGYRVEQRSVSVVKSPVECEVVLWPTRGCDRDERRKTWR